jgi:hypothetical protein
MKNIIKMSTLLALGIATTACFDGSDDKIEPGVNNPPQAVSINLITQAEVPITDQLSGSDSDGDLLTFTLEQGPTLGEVTISPSGAFTYQQFNEVTGSDSFTFMVRDGGGLSATANVGISIEALPVSFLSYSRDAFNANTKDDPLRINGRDFTQDVAGQSDYQDLIDGDSQ